MKDPISKHWKRLHNIRLSYLNSEDPIDNYWSDEGIIDAYDKTFVRENRLEMGSCPF